MKRNIIIGVIAVILCILLAYYWYSLNVVKEGLISAHSEFITDTIGMDVPAITKIQINDGADYLHFTNITIFDMNNNPINYTVSPNTYSNIKGIYHDKNGDYWLSNIYTNPPGIQKQSGGGYFHSKDKKDTLTITLGSGVKIKSIWITPGNTLDVSWRYRDYNLYLYNYNTLIAKQTLGILAVGNYLGNYSVNYIVSGPVGPAGAKGDNGKDGATGAKGDNGATGAKGDNGPTGAKGDKGYKGDNGPTGDKGDMGPQGTMGPQGDMGPQGPQGERGIPGLNGDMGPTGPTGSNGYNGTNGQMGGPVGVRTTDYSYFNASSIQTIEKFSIMDSLTEPMACLSSPAYYI